MHDPMITTAGGTTTLVGCPYCGLIHTGTCPRIKSIEYYPNGIVKRVELHSMGPFSFYLSGQGVYGRTDGND